MAVFNFKILITELSDKMRTKALVIFSVMWRERPHVRLERTVGRSDGDNPVCDGFERGGLCAGLVEGVACGSANGT